MKFQAAIPILLALAASAAPANASKMSEMSAMGMGMMPAVSRGGEPRCDLVWFEIDPTDLSCGKFDHRAAYDLLARKYGQGKGYGFESFIAGLFPARRGVLVGDVAKACRAAQLAGRAFKYGLGRDALDGDLSNCRQPGAKEVEQQLVDGEDDDVVSIDSFSFGSCFTKARYEELSARPGGFTGLEAEAQNASPEDLMAVRRARAEAGRGIFCKRPSIFMPSVSLLPVLSVDSSPSRPVAGPGVSVRRDDGPGLVLSDEQCQQIAVDLPALREWTARIGEPVGPMPIVRRLPGGRCEADISGIIPKFVRDHHLTCPVADGPNCWNTALMLSELIPASRYSSQDEVNFWLSSPLCRPLGQGEPSRPGDFIEVRHGFGTGGDAEVHGFIYIAPELVFSKNGSDSLVPFALQSLQSVLKHYRVDVPHGCGRAVDRPSNCERWAKYFRCEPYQDWQRRNPSPDASERKVAGRVLDAIDAELSAAALGKRSQGVARLQARYGQLTRLRERSRKETGMATNDVDRLGWRALNLRADSLLEQIRLLGGMPD